MNIDWSTYDRGELSPEMMKKHTRYVSRIFEMFDCNTKNKTAIEIGAGHGTHTRIFKPFFKKYNAVEPDKTLMEKFKTNHPDTNIIQKKCEDIEVTGQLSFVIFTNSFQFTDKDVCIDKVNQLLKPKGFCLFMFPHPVNFKGGINEKSKRWTYRINKIIKYLVELDGFDFLYVGTLWNMYYVLIKKK